MKQLLLLAVLSLGSIGAAQAAPHATTTPMAYDTACSATVADSCREQGHQTRYKPEGLRASAPQPVLQQSVHKG